MKAPGAIESLANSAGKPHCCLIVKMTLEKAINTVKSQDEAL